MISKRSKIVNLEASEVTDVHELLAILPTLFDNSLDNVVVYDAHATPIYCNVSMLKTLNVSSAIEAFKNQQAQSPCTNQVRKVLETGLGHYHVVEMHDPSFNQDIFDLVHFSPIKNKQEQILGVMVTGRDLDFIKQKHNQEIKRREYNLRVLLDNLPLVVWMKNKQHQLLVVNQHYADLVGIKNVYELEGKTDFDLFSPEIARLHVDDANQVIQTGLDKNSIEEIKPPNGETYWAYTHKSQLKIDDDIIGTVGFSRDISVERGLQAEITERKNEYRALIDNLPVAIMVYDLECRRVLINAWYSKLIKVTGADSLGKRPTEHWSPFVLNLTGERYEQYLQEVIATGESVTFDMIHCQNEVGTTVHDVKLMPQKSISGAVTGVIAIVNDVTAIYKSQQRSEYLALHDALTGLANRTLFAEKLAQALDAAKLKQAAFAVMILDLDEFKAINDSMGHAIGDKLLKDVAQRIQNIENTEHLCARLGGDEFAILLQNIASKDQAEALAKSLLNALTQVYEIDGTEYFISASIGVALYPEHTGDTDDLMKFADSAMYHAKREGRNHFQFYSPQLTHNVHKQLQLETALRYAIEAKELYLEYQPILNIATQQMVGVEALCRWQHPKLGFVSPMEFIQTAERTGLIVALGLHLMHEAFVAAHTINSHSRHLVTVSVNLSAKQFNKPEFVDQVTQLLLQTQCQPHWIKFEITETLLLENKPLVIDALHAFDAMGIKISLDDFGTGQSALGYLHKFPIHQIKIDRSFIHEIHENENSSLLVKAIVVLANTLNKELVAEGVETDAHAELLQSFNCQNGQGFLYSKSLALPSLLEFLSQSKQSTD